MERLSMRKIREVLRLKYEAGLSARAIARSVNAGRTTVQEYLQRFAASGLSWPTELDDAALESRLFPPPPPAGTARPEPDWTVVQRELRRKGVTLLLLCKRSANPPLRVGANQGNAVFFQFHGRSSWSFLLGHVGSFSSTSQR